MREMQSEMVAFSYLCHINLIIKIYKKLSKSAKTHEKVYPWHDALKKMTIFA